MPTPQISSILPGWTGLPLIGETVSFLSDMMSFVNTRVARFGGMFRTHVLGSDTAILANYDAVLSHLQQQAGQLSAPMAYKEFLSSVYPKPNLLLSEEGTDTRLASETVLQNALGDSSKLYTETIHQIVTEFFNDIVPPCRVELYTTIRGVCEAALFKTILGVVSGKEVKYIRSLASTHFAGVVAAPVRVRALGVATARAKAIDAHSTLHNYIAKLLQDAVSMNKHAHRDDEVSVLTMAAATVASGRASIEEATETIVVLLSPVISKALAAAVTNTLLATRQLGGSAWARLQSSSRGRHLDPSRIDDIDAALMESLRVAPPIAGTMRLAQHNNAVAGVHAGWRVWSSLMHANTDVSVYQDAPAYNPSRWFNSAKTHHLKDGYGCPFAWPGEELDESFRMPLSFGAGGRRCKGRDLAWLIMREVISAFVNRFEVIDEVVDWNAEMRYFPVTRPVQDRKVELGRKPTS